MLHCIISINTICRETLVVLGAVCLLFWTGIYFLVSLQQSHTAAPDPGRQQLLDSRGREMERALEEAQRQMKAQVRANTALLTKLRRLRSEMGLNQARVVNSLFVEGLGEVSGFLGNIPYFMA